MIHEFNNPIPIMSELGGGLLLYVRCAGSYHNDIFAVVCECDGRIRHMRSDQFVVIENPTFDIKN